MRDSMAHPPKANATMTNMAGTPITNMASHIVTFAVRGYRVENVGHAKKIRPRSMAARNIGSA